MLGQSLRKAEEKVDAGRKKVGRMRGKERKRRKLRRAVRESGNEKSERENVELKNARDRVGYNEEVLRKMRKREQENTTF